MTAAESTTAAAPAMQPVASNRHKLVRQSVVGEVTAPRVRPDSPYRISIHGEPRVLPATGGVIDNIRVALQALSNRFDMWTRRDAMRSQIEQAAALLEQVGLADKRLRLAGTLAHGEQRSLEVAMALAANPRVLLLDEPTAGMSPEETRAMMDLVVSLAKGRTIVLVEHKMKLVMGISSRIIVLHHGEILADGSPEVIRASDEVRRVYLGKEAAAA